MDVREFHSTAEAILRNLMPRIPPDGVELLELTISGGEYGYTIKDLAGLIALHRIKISSQELAWLQRLLAYLGREVKPEIFALVDDELEPSAQSGENGAGFPSGGDEQRSLPSTVEALFSSANASNCLY